MIIMINETLLNKVENIADEFGVDVRTLDEIVGETPVIDVDNEDVIVLTIQLLGDSEMPEVDDEITARLDKVVSLLEDEDVALIELLSQKVSVRVLDSMPENTEVALMME
jgi:hypothetical protein